HEPSLNVEAAAQPQGEPAAPIVQAASGSLVFPPWGRPRSPSGEHSNGRAASRRGPPPLAGLTGSRVVAPVPPGGFWSTAPARDAQAMSYCKAGSLAG